MNKVQYEINKESQQKLKLRLKFKQVNNNINSIVNWNFGYCPAENKDFDKDLEERNQIINVAKNLYPDLYEQFMDIIDNQ